MNLKSFLEQATFKLRQAGSTSPRLDAELLTQYVLKLNRIELMTKDHEAISVSDRAQLEALLLKRLEGEPVAYLIGKKEFFGFDFAVGSGVLVPRPETEMLVEIGLEALDKTQSALIADLGAGTGCIGLSVLLERKNVKGVFIESSARAFSYLCENAKKHELTDRATLLDAPVQFAEFEQVFDLILSNPPYIDQQDTHVHPWVRRHEPAAALFSPEQGLQTPKEWIMQGSRWLKPGGTMAFEIGSAQGAHMLDWCRQEMKGFEITLGKDLAGLDRCIKLVDTR